MCGPSQQQQDITDEQQDFYRELTNEYSTVFAQNQGITGALTSAFLPILQAGPSQTGMSLSEENALRTQNAENVATNYRQAQAATADILAARGGGNTFLPSGLEDNLYAQNTNAAAATRAQGDLGITQRNFDLGYQNWQTAASMLAGTAGLLSPTSFASTATGAGNSAATSAANVTAASMSPWTSAIGALTSLGGTAMSTWGG